MFPHLLFILIFSPVIIVHLKNKQPRGDRALHFVQLT